MNLSILIFIVICVLDVNCGYNINRHRNYHMHEEYNHHHNDYHNYPHRRIHNHNYYGAGGIIFPRESYGQEQPQGQDLLDSSPSQSQVMESSSYSAPQEQNSSY